MKSKVKYTNEPMRKLRVVDDFLPASEDLMFKGVRPAKRRAVPSDERPKRRSAA